MAKRRWYSSSSFLSFLSFFSLVRFPLKQKPKGRTMKMKGTRFLFPFGNNEKNRGDKARGGICWSMERGHGQAANPAHVPNHWKRIRKDKGLHSPLMFSLCFLSLKRTEREGGGEIDRIAFLMGRAKTTMEERWIKDKERQNKAQRRWDSSLSILSPLSLPSLFLLEIRKTKRKN